MPEKKKSPAVKRTETRMTKPQGAKTVKSSDSERTSARDGAAAVAQPLDSSKQLSSFESAMRLFHERKLQQARDLFQTASEGPERDVAQRARLHIAMCDRRLEQQTVKLQSPEDYYNYGIAMLNVRNIAEARRHLEQAAQLSPAVDHVHYALATALALSGEPARAHEHLQRAIELEPRNRVIARQDPD